MTRRQQELEQVAYILLNQIAPADQRWAVQNFYKINHTCGFSFAIRYHDGEYINREDYTWVDGLKITKEEVREVIKIAGGFLLEG